MTNRPYIRIVAMALVAMVGALPCAAGLSGTGGPLSADSQMILEEVQWKSRSHSAEQTAISYLAEEVATESRSQTEFVVTGTEAVPGGFHVRLRPTFSGIPIFRSMTVISINGRNEVIMVARDHSTDIELSDLTPALGPREGAELAKKHLNPTGPISSESTEGELVIYRDSEGRASLAYRSSIVSENPMGDWEILIDANSGELILMEDRFVQYQHRNGSGFAYLPDPVSSSGAFYGEKGFEDNNDLNSDSLNHYRTPVILDSLLFIDGQYRLLGPYCTIQDIESPNGSEDYRSLTPDGFRFTRNDQGFEAVNIYYHVSESYNYLRSLGFDIVSLRNLRIDPHGYDGKDNSHYSPSGNWMAFGEGGVDDAEDAEVIWHEYAHAIQYNINPVWGGGESHALGEGFGDYWAASYARSLGVWDETDDENNWLFHWDGHNSFWDGRILNDSRTYPFGNISSHEAGQIWSSALLGIWGDLGKEVTDRLVLKSQYYLGYGVTARDAARAILQADRDLYEGKHLSVLAHWLGTVKNFLDPSEELPAISHTPVANSRNPVGTYRIIATITQGRNAGPVSVFLCWRIDGGPADTLVMTVDPENRYVAEIPGSGIDGRYEYYIIATDRDGNTAASPYAAPEKLYSFEVGESVTAETMPEQFALSQNFPNPFNPSTVIPVDLAVDALVTLKVYDLLGREVSVLLDGIQPAGQHRITWTPTSDGRPLATGAYIYRMDATSVSDGSRITQTKKMLYIR